MVRSVIIADIISGDRAPHTLHDVEALCDLVESGVDALDDGVDGGVEIRGGDFGEKSIKQEE